MTRKLEELFDLPPQIEEEPVEEAPSKEKFDSLDSALAEVDKIEEALPMVKGLEATDIEMDELAQKAIDSYGNLMDLGMNVDARYSAEILSVASNMLGHAITAKTAKLNKKLRMVDLQLKKLALDRRSADPAVPLTTGSGHVLDRNELLQRLTGAKDKDTQKE